MMYRLTEHDQIIPANDPIYLSVHSIEEKVLQPQIPVYRFTVADDIYDPARRIAIRVNIIRGPFQCWSALYFGDEYYIPAHIYDYGWQLDWFIKATLLFEWKPEWSLDANPCQYVQISPHKRKHKVGMTISTASGKNFGDDPTVFNRSSVRTPRQSF